MRPLYFPSCYLQNLGRKICLRRKINREKILILKFSLQNFKCGYITAKDLVISAKISEVDSPRRFESSLNMFRMKYLEFPWFDFPNFGSRQDKNIGFKPAGMIPVIPLQFWRYWPLK